MGRKKNPSLKTLKAPPKKRAGKQEREQKVLLGLVELYLRSGKPIGSNTLRDHGFQDLSSATIRNYFAELEKQGFLQQQHSSGGRLPTHAAYRLYAETYLDYGILEPEHGKTLEELESEGKEANTFLQKAANKLSEMTETAVFISAPRFDHDFIQKVQLVSLDINRCLCVLVTDFGLVHTEVLRSEEDLTEEFLAELEEYFRWRFTGEEKLGSLGPEQLELAQNFYNEVMVRYIVGYANFVEEEVYRTGFSQLLAYPEFQDVAQLAGGLSLFENRQGMRLLLRECGTQNRMKVWVGEDLKSYTQGTPECSVITMPYHIHGNVGGAVGILGPARIPYRTLFGALHAFSEAIGEQLTRMVHKHRIQYRQPKGGELYYQEAEESLVEEAKPILLEDKTDE